MTINMNPQGVHAAADDLTQLAGQASSKAEHSLDNSSAAATAHSGWQTSTAITDCQQAWEKHLTDLIAEINTEAGKLHSSAATNEQTDTEAAKRFNQVLSELSK